MIDYLRSVPWPEKWNPEQVKQMAEEMQRIAREHPVQFEMDHRYQLYKEAQMKEAMDYSWNDKLDNGTPVKVFACDYETGDDSVGAGSSCGVIARLDDGNGEEVKLTRAEEMRFMLAGLDLYEDNDTDYYGELPPEFHDDDDED